VLVVVVESRPVRRAATAFVLLTLSSVIAFLSCASDQVNTLVSPSDAGAPGVKRFLVCAPNTMIALPAELQGATATLRQHVDAYFQFHERDAEWLDLYESKRLWTEALAAAKTDNAIARTPAYFAKAAAKEHQFDAIVVPSILLHQVRAVSSYAKWDGVERRMKVVGAPKKHFSGAAKDTLVDGIENGGISGDVMVTSVHVLVYTREGEKVFEGRGGIAFVHDIDLSHIQKKHLWSYRMRDPVVDVGSLREGIAIAFHPYLTQPDED
jgi:hypothetical protein